MPLELAVAFLMMGGLTLYALCGGADFGGGVWEFNTALRAPEKERALVYRAIGPVWEANHVWLIFVVVAFFTAFPEAFAALNRNLWVPLLLALVGIVFRGVAFAFRSYAAGAVRQQALWGAVFALASTAAPFFLGATVGAIASGRLPARPTGAQVLTGWITPMSAYGGFFGVGICAYLAAVYLTREAHLEGDAALTHVWRRRALWTGAWMGLLSTAGLVVMAADAPMLWQGFRERAWPMVAASAVTGFGSLVLLWRGRFTAAALGAALTVSTVLWGWALGQYPLLFPPDFTIQSAKAPDTVLQAVLWTLAGGGVVLLPSLLLLFHLFKGKRPA